MKKSVKIFIVIIIFVVMCLGISLVELQTKILRQTIDNLVFDNRNHYLPCDQLPTEAEARAIIDLHQDSIQAIKDMRPGYVGVNIDTTSCPGKADMVIWYGSHADRLTIETIIEDETFFGVPFRLRNQ